MLRSVKSLPAATLLVGLPLAPALAQDYPSKPVELYVNYGAGGGTDLSFRAFGQLLSLCGHPSVRCHPRQ